VPIGSYSLQVAETLWSHRETKEVQLLLEEDKVYEKQVFVGVRQKQDKLVHVNFLEQENDRSKQIRSTDQLDIKAVLLPAAKQDDLEDFEFDIIYDDDQKIWTAQLPDGTFLLTVKSNEFKEINETIVVKSGKENYFEIGLSSKNKDVPQIIVTTIDISKQEALGEVLVNFKREGFNSSEENLTGVDGSCIFGVKTIGIHTLRCEREGFITFERQLNFGKGFLQLPMPQEGCQNI